MLFVLAAVGVGGWMYVRRRRSEGEQGERLASGLDVGLVLHPGARGEQQDAALIVDDVGTDGDGPVQLFIVADGMGGVDGGRRASRAAVRAFRDAFQRHLSGVEPGEVLRLALETAHRAVCALDRRPDVPGTTLVAAVVGAAGVEWIASGDSRLYLLREGDLVQLTADHSLQRDYALAVARGRADDGYAPESNVITSYLGIGGGMTVDRSVRPLPLEERDRLLLSTDGLYGQLSDDELAAGLGDGSAPDVAQRLVDRVVTRGRPGQDNLTALVVDVDRRFQSSATTSRPSINPAVRP
jgi:protein phosphatase